MHIGAIATVFLDVLYFLFLSLSILFFFFFFNDTATTEIYTLSLHDALPIYLEFPLIHGNAESVPYPDQSFDFAISEYGACLWADPMKWIAEAARLLRPGGRLHFLTNAFLLMLCADEDETKPATDRLLRPAFDMYRMEWPGESGIEFHLSHADWIRLLRDAGFEIEDLVEIRPPEGATTRYAFVTADWARKWPSEEVWKARKRG